jgi:hypothetical protein
MIVFLLFVVTEAAIVQLPAAPLPRESWILPHHCSTSLLEWNCLIRLTTVLVLFVVALLVLYVPRGPPLQSKTKLQ